MAITHQLARLATDHLQRCEVSVVDLDEVCSFLALPSTDYIDLNWAPASLLSAVPMAMLNRWSPSELVCAVGALELGTSGVVEVNRNFRGEVGVGQVHENPRSLSAEHVDVVGAALRRADADPVLWLVNDRRAVPENGEAVPGLVGMTQDVAAAYLREHWRALVDFYAAAAADHQAVIVWMD